MKVLRYILLLSLAVFSLLGCTRRDLAERPTDGFIRIVLDWGPSGGRQQPSGYMFYDSEGAAFYRQGDENGYEGRIPAGTYNIIMVSEEIEGATVVGPGDYSVDYIYADALDSDNNIPPQYIKDEYKALSASKTGIVVSASHIPVTVPMTPENLAYLVRFRLDPQQITDIRSVDFRVGNIVYSVLLNDRAPSGLTSSRNKEAVFNQQDQVFETVLSVFGYKPGVVFTADVEYADGLKESTVPVDITDKLDEAWKEEQKEVNIDIVLPSGNQIGLTVAVSQWDSSGSGWGEV